jgi:uncharacterized protein (DUF302 family)
VTKAIEARLQRFSVPKLMEYVTHGDREGVEAYVDEVSSPSKFSIFWEMEQGSTMRLAGIPIESKFYLVGNAVVARDLFRYSAAAGLGAPVRVCVSQRDGEETRINLDQVTAFFSQFPETRPSDVPRLLDTGDGQGLRRRRLDQRRESGPGKARARTPGSCSLHGPLIRDSVRTRIEGMVPGRTISSIRSRTSSLFMSGRSRRRRRTVD